MMNYDCKARWTQFWVVYLQDRYHGKEKSGTAENTGSVSVGFASYVVSMTISFGVQVVYVPNMKSVHWTPSVVMCS